MDEKKFDADLERDIDRRMRILRGRVAEDTLNTRAFQSLLKQVQDDEPFVIPYAVLASPAFPKDLREHLRKHHAVSDSAYGAQKLSPFYDADPENKVNGPRICFLAHFQRNIPFMQALKNFRRAGLIVADVNTFLGTLNTGLFNHGTTRPNVIIAGSSVKYWGGEAKLAREDMPVYRPGDGFEILPLDWVMKEETVDPIKKCYLVHQHV